LVPSLTEAVAPTGLLVGATDWCTQPAGLDVPRVRGTKNPDLAAIVGLAPDVVLANKEENRELDVRRLRDAGVPVWVTDVESVPQAVGSLARIFTSVLGQDVPDWLNEAEQLWSGPPAPVRARVAVPIWRDPWMVIGPRTFADDVLRRVGLDNVFAGANARYPHVDLTQIDRDDVDLVLLPDEPYRFSDADGPEAFSQAPTMLVDGRLLTWYGPSLVEAHARLSALRHD